MTDITYRALSTGDLENAHALSLAAGWPHRVEDWDFAHQLGSGIGAFDNHRLCGTGYGWRHGTSFATLGMVIVSPEMQGKGIGRQIMQALMGGAGSGTQILNATKAGLRLYEKLGFRRVGTVRQHQNHGCRRQEVKIPDGSCLRPIAGNDLKAVLALDAIATGMDRTRAIEAVASASNGIVLEKDGSVSGVSFPRRFGRGYVIGPTIAEAADDAKALIGTLLNEYPAEFLRLDVPAEGDLSDWLAARGLPQVSEVVTMRRGHKPDAQQGGSRVFSLINQALG